MLANSEPSKGGAPTIGIYSSPLHLWAVFGQGRVESLELKERFTLSNVFEGAYDISVKELVKGLLQLLARAEEAVVEIRIFGWVNPNEISFSLTFK